MCDGTDTVQEINSNILSYAWQEKAALCGLVLIYFQSNKCVSCYLRFFPSNMPKYPSISTSGMDRSFVYVLLNGTKTEAAGRRRSSPTPRPRVQ